MKDVCLSCVCRLLDHCRRHRYLSQSGEELALLLSSLLENLLAYRTITHDESPEHRMSCTVNVLVCPLCNYIKQISMQKLQYLSKWRERFSAICNFILCRISTKKRRGRIFIFGELDVNIASICTNLLNVSNGLC